MINDDFTYQQSMQYIQTPKVILESDGNVCKQKMMDFVVGFSESLNLQSEDGKIMFKWTIKQSPKELIKLSLNIIDKDSNIGVFRVDYVAQKTRHQNPAVMTGDVPEVLKQYCNADIYGPHAHFNVAGYRSLVWAVPLKDLDYEAQSIVDDAGLISIANAVYCFAKYIHVKTPIVAQTTII